MKVLFAGPSLAGTGWSTNPPDPALDCRGPAGQGDIARAVVEGASAIGLIDGRYEDVAAVWHKEILFAIEQGVQVFGAASMGALRAAECADFGMIGIGAIYERYRSGELADDAAVAVTHAPPELDHAPLTEALVNVEATLDLFRKLGAISEDEAERTYARILAHAGLKEGPRGKELADLIKRCRVDVKRQDALLLLSYFGWLEPERRAPPEWQLEPTVTWRLTLERALELANGSAAPAEPVATAPPAEPAPRPARAARQPAEPAYPARSKATATP